MTVQKNNFLYIVLTFLLGTCGSFALTIASIGCSFYLFDQNKLLTRNISNRVGNKSVCSKIKTCLTSCLQKSNDSNCNCDPQCALLSQFNRILYHPFTELLVTFVIVVDIIFIFLSLLSFDTHPQYQDFISYGTKVRVYEMTVSESYF
jgi:hypothetical protein